jgi:hypothetical protein
MLDKKILTITEFARMGARAQRQKYSKKQLREWARLGGRPRKRKAKVQ